MQSSKPPSRPPDSSSSWISNHTVALSALSTDATSQLDVLGHDGHTLGVDGTEIRVFEQADLKKSNDQLSFV
jgi:hypothetical protein